SGLWHQQPSCFPLGREQEKGLRTRASLSKREVEGSSERPVSALPAPLPLTEPLCEEVGGGVADGGFGVAEALHEACASCVDGFAKGGILGRGFLSERFADFSELLTLLGEDGASELGEE